MGLVIRRVEVLPVPARGEVDLGSNAIRAGDCWEGWSLWRASTGIVEADVRDGLLLKGLIVRAELGVASQDAEPGRERHQLFSGIRYALLVVNGAARDRNFGESAILLTVEHVGHPVVGEIAINGARCAGGLLSVIVIHIGRECIASKDNVGMAGWNSGRDDGVKTTSDESTTAGHPPVCVDGAGE